MRWQILLFPILGMGGCGLIPDYRTEPPTVPVPQAWSAAFDASATEPLPWLEALADPQLRTLIEEALAANYDLQAAAARVASARAAARIAGVDRFPQLAGGIKGSRTQRNSTSGFRITNPRTNSFGVDFTLNWELDVWGKLQNRSNAAKADFAASEQDYRAARLSLAAGVASAWFMLIEAGQQLRLAEQKVDAFEQTRSIIHDGFVAGIYGALDLRLARANLTAAQSQRDARKIDLDRAKRGLEVLLGRYPNAGLIAAKRLPTLKQPIETGLPGSLLRRRPDLVAAEQRLLAADQRFTAAWKNLLPTFSFSASGGTNAAQLADMFNYNNLVWNILGNLTQPIFQGGRLLAEKELADAQTLEAVSLYAQIILQAYYEVETALTAERLLQTQQAALQHTVQESVEAERLALEEYGSGLTDLITLLEAQRRSYDAQSALLQISAQRLVNRITLYLALGGNLTGQQPQPLPADDSFLFGLFD